MSEPKGFKGLRAAAEATVLREVQLTPELQAAVLEHVAELALPDEAPPPRPTRRWLGGAGVVATAALTIVVAVALSRPVPPAAPGPSASGPAAGAAGAAAPAGVKGDTNSFTLNAAAQDTARSAAPAAPVALAPSPVGGSSSSTIPVRVLDSNGTAVDQAGAKSVSPAAHGPGAAGGVEAEPGRKIVMNGEYALEVSDVRATADQLRSVTVQAGGYVADATVNSSGPDAWAGHLLLRIPAAAFAGSTQQLRQLGRLISEREWTQDVTDQYVDLEHRIAIQQAQEKRLEDLAAKADKFDDWNRVTSQMNETQAQIENMQGKLKQLGNQVDYAIVSVSLVQAQPGAAVLPANPTLGQQAGQAFARSWHRLGQNLRQGLVALVGFLPTLLLLLPCLALLAWLAWRWRRAGRAP